jgi:hypothetical protein
LFASIAEAIGDQIGNMFRIIFFMWIFSSIIKSEDWRAIIFVFVAAFSAWFFVMEHIAYTRFFVSGWYSNIFQIIPSEFKAVAGLFVPLSLVCTYFLKKHGLLSAIAVHFICDFMWRIVWGWIQIGNEMFNSRSNTLSLQFRLITIGVFVVICVIAIAILVMALKKTQAEQQQLE